MGINLVLLCKLREWVWTETGKGDRLGGDSRLGPSLAASEQLGIPLVWDSVVPRSGTAYLRDNIAYLLSHHHQRRDEERPAEGETAVVDSVPRIEM